MPWTSKTDRSIEECFVKRRAWPNVPNRNEEIVITRRRFIRTSTIAGAGFFTWKESVRAQSTSRAPDLTGIWSADDGATYFIRHLDDNTIWWAGLHAYEEFYAGVRFTNVFRGNVNLANRTIEGVWADVPRGWGILQQGRLSLEIVETTSPNEDGRRRPPGCHGERRYQLSISN